MIWKEEFNKLEKGKKWIDAIQLLRNVIAENDNEPEPSVRMIYLLHNLLLEEDFKNFGFEHDHLANLLLKYFQESFRKFENNAEYLFFIGIILHIAEWYFGQDDVHLALQTQKRAVELEPKNELFQFSYDFALSNKESVKRLSSKLLQNKTQMQWLKSKGFPGQYVLGLIQTIE